MLNDFKFSLRNLRNNPGFAVVAIITLALGIGANTAIFSVVNAVLLKPLPYPDPDRLVYIDESTKSGGRMSIAWPNFVDYRAQSRSFQSLSAVRTFNHSLIGVGQPQIVIGMHASAGLLEDLGAKPVIGRFYGPADDKPGAASVAVLSYDFWMKQFQGDPAVVGRAVNLDQTSCTIIGVAPAGFGLVSRNRDLFLPIGPIGANRGWQDRGNHVGIRALGRLKPGVTLDSALADMKALSSRLEQQYPVSNSGVGVLMEPYSEVFVQDSRATLKLLLAAVGFVLLTACVNVANLLLARGSARTREISIRAALGATRLQVIRQLLVESVVLSAVGGALGCLIAAWGVDTLLRFAPTGIPRLAQARLDFTVLGFTLGLSVLTGILFGLVPALRLSRPDLVHELKTGGRGQTAGRASQRLRHGLLVAEVALALLMVAGGGLMMRSIWALNQVNPGFDTNNVLSFGVTLSDAKYKTEATRLTYFQRALEKVRAVPGVESAALVDCLPLDGGCWGSIFTIGGRPIPPNDQLPQADFNSASEGYFQTLKVPLIEGRYITEADTKDSTKVIVINQTMARHLFPGESALGKTIRQGFPQSPGPVREVVGVVGDVQRYELDHPRFDEVYFAVSQNAGAAFDFVVRTHGDPLTYTRAIEDALHQVDADQPIANFRPMNQVLADTLANRKFTTILLGIFAGLALGLAAVGIYGVTAYSVTLRTQEVGIRMALGARQSDVLKLVLRQGLGFSLAGVAAGLIAASGMTWLIASQLYGVRPRDPATLAAAAVTLVFVALAACYFPARRAAKLDPMEALRTE